MQPDALDSFARALTLYGSRRVVVAALLGGPLAWWEQLGASARRRKGRKKRKKKGRNRRSNRQNCAATCPGCCDPNGFCQAGTATANCGTGGEACQRCAGGQICTAGGTCAPPGCGTGGPCLVFVTSTTHNGNLGGLTGADLICQQRAQAVNLPGTYKAWLADSTGSPDSRFMKSTGPYRRLDGVTVADSYADLTTCATTDPFACLDNPIIVTEIETETNSVLVWSNSLASGLQESPPRDCDSWRSPAGTVLGNIGMSDPIESDRSWTDLDSTNFCDSTLRLYCFQQS